MRIDIELGRRVRERTARGPSRRLVASLEALAGGHATILRHSERAWASITFSGTRHTLVLTFAGAEAVAAGEQFIAAVPDHEFAIPGQIVADVTVQGADHVLLPEPCLTVELEMLLLEDC